MSLLFTVLRNITPRRRTRAPDLKEIFLRSNRGDIHKWHHYFDVYERYLSPLRNRPVSILEIGLWRGGSLRMWREYFGPSATIFGLDVHPSAAAFSRGGFRIFIGDQADPAFLETVRDEIGPIDVVLDDGGHTMRQQVNSFETLYPATTHAYIVEDTHTSYWAAYHDRPEGTFIDYAKAKVDLLHEWHWNPQSLVLHNKQPQEAQESASVSEFCATTRGIHFYDSIVVFEKGENPPRRSEIR